VPRFSYVVKDANGKTITDAIEATDQDNLVRNLQEKGYFIVSVQQAASSPRTTVAVTGRTSPTRVAKPKKRSQYTHKNIRLEDLLTFCHQLATMLEAGVTLIRSLDVIATQIESREFARVLKKVTKDVEGGMALSASLSKHPRVFNQFWVSLIEVGEASGTMPNVLQKLAFYLEQQSAFRSTVTSAIIYPAILFFVANIAIVFFAFFVGPRFETIFDSFGVELPLITKILLATFSFIKSKFLVLIGTIGAILFVGRKYIQTPGGRVKAEKFLFDMPVVGRIYKLIIVERFTSQMSLLIESGVPILYALDIAERLVDNKTCEIIVHDIKNVVREGGLLVEAMSRSEFFPPMAIQMVLVGEETGELGKMLTHVAKFYQRNVEIFLKRFSTLIEPVMLIFMGVVIGVIVIAMFLPMFNISQLR
jgi:type II secretory pathway component PulF